MKKIIIIFISAFLIPFTSFAIPVFDGANLAKNIASAKNTAKIIGQKVKELRKLETQINLGKDRLARMDQNLRNMEDIVKDTRLTGIQKAQQIIINTNSISYEMDKLKVHYDSIFKKYPSTPKTSELMTDRERQLDTVQKSTYEAMKIHARSIENLKGDRDDLVQALEAARRSEGNLQIQQSTAEIQGVQARTLMQINQVQIQRDRREALKEAEQDAKRKAQRERSKYLMTDFDKPIVSSPMATLP